jgi:hypothetical protein
MVQNWSDGEWNFSNEKNGSFGVIFILDECSVEIREKVRAEEWRELKIEKPLDHRSDRSFRTGERNKGPIMNWREWKDK